MARKIKLLGLFILIMSMLIIGCNGKPEANVTPNPQESDTRIQDEPAANIKTAEGEYVGQIDNNSVEIKLSNLPQPVSARAFQLSDELNAKWDEINLKDGEKITITYLVREGQNSLLQDVKRINE